MSSEDEETNGMQKIYEECNKLTEEYSKVLYNQHKTSLERDCKGDSYFRDKLIETLKRDCKTYFTKCVDEKSYRKPKKQKPF